MGENDHDWHAVKREEHLYHESAGTLASMVVNLEGVLAERDEQLNDARVALRGADQENARLESKIEEAADLVAQHQIRYSNAMKMIQMRQRALSHQKSAYQKLAEMYSKLADRHVQLVKDVAQINQSVVSLHDVPLSDLDKAISAVANALDTAVLS